MKNNRVGIYCRLSNEDRDKEGDFSNSIQTQKMMLVDYALEKQWNITKIYIDDNFSGGNQNRPAFIEMIDDCKNNRIDIVLCKSQSRFSREISIIEHYLNDKFLQWGIRFVSIVDNIDTDLNGNRKTRQINGLINEWYLEDMSDSIRASLKARMKNGEYMGAFTPYGYMKDPENKHNIIPDPVASEIVRKIYDWYVQGDGAILICRKLNNMGVPCPAVYKQNQKDSKNYKTQINKNKVWVHSTISKMIPNEIYIGTLIQGKQQNLSYKCHKKIKVDKENQIIIKDNHEPIIDKSTWELAQEIRKSKTRNRNPARQYPHISIKSKVFCGKCGSRMSKEVITNKQGKCYSYLICSIHRQCNICSNHFNYNIETIEQSILEEINKLLASYYNENMITIQEKKSNYEQEIKSINNRIALLKNNIQKKEELKFNLYQDKVNQEITPSDYIKFSNQAQSDINLYQSEINQLTQRCDKIKNNNLKKEDNKDLLLSKYKHIDTLTPNIVSEFIDKIELSTNDEGNKIVDITWNF